MAQVSLLNNHASAILNCTSLSYTVRLNKTAQRTFI